MDIMTTEQVGRLWGVAFRRVSELCWDGRIKGASKIGTSWVMPADAQKPGDARVTNGKWIGYERKHAFIFDFSDPTTWITCQNADDFRQQFQFLRAYHGCRPLRISDYTENGLQILNKKRLFRLTHELLGKYVEEKELNNIIETRWDRYPAKGIYFALDKNELLNQCGHYMIYGSEFVCGIAAQCFCQPKLKQRGIPTIISANVPTALISDFTIQELVDKVQTHFYGAKTVDFGFRITQNLSAKHIVKIEHPHKIADPLNGYLSYYYSEENKSND
ncbi:hypothetical protein IMSAGC005_03076 [Lachnospiraceae bacterium]|nr:hypothetical protein IMSAGC005_03076 [Lachnospiraceae bacterium]